MTRADVEALKLAGLTGGEISDVVNAVAARCFFSKILDALGVQADPAYHDLDENLQQTLTIGRQIE